MILGFRGKRTSDFAAGRRVKAFSGIERGARLKLDRLEAATGLKDLAALPGIVLRPLPGIGRGSTAFASTTNGGSVLTGPMELLGRQMSKSSITTRGYPWQQ